MRRRNKYIILATLVFIAASVVAARYIYSRGFTKKWREYITEEFAERGVFLDFEKLTMDPVRGLIAREVTLFDGEDRRRTLAKIDHISLDIDYAGLVGRELFLDSIDLKDADLWFRLEPEKPGGERLVIHNFSARVYLTGDRIQIRRAEGLVNGVEVSLRGLFFNPAAGADTSVFSGGQKAVREVLASAVRWLGKLKFDPEAPPQIEVDIHGGDLGRPEDLRATVHFVGNSLSIGSYECDRIEAILETGRGAVVLKRFTVTDESGRLDADAEYHFGDATARFHLESEADLPGFLLGALGWKPVAEIVFYESPKVSVSGEIPLWQFGGLPAMPLRAVGRVESGTLGSRGRLFESAQADFSIDGEHFYLRNVVLEHRTGGFSAEAMLDENGFRYRATLTLDPRVFEPFCAKASTLELLRRFEFGRESSVFAEISGTGRDTDPANWESRSEIDLRNFSFSGIDVRRFETVLELGSAVQSYSEIRVALEDTQARADHVKIDSINEMVEIRNLRGDIDLVDWGRSFGLDLEDELGIHTFQSDAEFEADGVLDLRADGRSDLEVEFRGSASDD